MDITDISTQLLLGFGGLLALVNVLLFLAFAIDRGRARHDQRRIPASFLLKLAFLGGWPGAKLAQVVFGCQTQEPPFRTRLNLIMALQVACAAAGFAVIYAPDIDFKQLGSAALATVMPPDQPADVPVTAQVEAATGPEAPKLPHRFGPGSDG
jgi:uncharacterized membrane protein YsdA (DUF1294 family)